MARSRGNAGSGSSAAETSQRGLLPHREPNTKAGKCWPIQHGNARARIARPHGNVAQLVERCVVRTGIQVRCLTFPPSKPGWSGNSNMVCEATKQLSRKTYPTKPPRSIQYGRGGHMRLSIKVTR